MDRTVHNNSELLDELIAVLGKHGGEPGIAEALAYLKAARTNYVQRSIDHMMNCLVLMFHELVRHPPNKELSQELGSVIQGYVKWIGDAGSRMRRLAEEYEAGGGKLLSREEVLRELDERRGLSGR